MNTGVNREKSSSIRFFGEFKKLPCVRSIRYRSANNVRTRIAHGPSRALLALTPWLLRLLSGVVRPSIGRDGDFRSDAGRAPAMDHQERGALLALSPQV